MPLIRARWKVNYLKNSRASSERDRDIERNSTDVRSFVSSINAFVCIICLLLHLRDTRARELLIEVV